MLEVLVVDDEALVCMGIRACIQWEEHGYHFAGEARDGESALRLMEKSCPDIVLTDIKMPGMDGVELLRRIRKDYPHVKVIMLSCLNEMDIVRQTLLLGAMDYVFKLSLRTDDLLEILDRAKKEIEREKEEQQTKEREKQLFQHNRKNLESEAVKRYLFEKGRAGEFSEKIKLLGLEKALSSAWLFRIRLLQDDAAAREMAEHVSVQGWLEQSLPIEGKKIVVSYGLDYVVLIGTGAKRYAKADMEAVASAMLEQLEKHGKVKAIAAVSDEISEYPEIQSHFAVLEKLMALHFYFSERYLFLEKDRRTLSNAVYYIPSGVEEGIYGALMSGDLETASAELRKVVEDIRMQAAWEPQRIRRAFQNFLENLQRKVIALCPGANLESMADVLARVEEAATLQYLWETVDGAMKEWAQMLQAFVSPHKREIEMAKHYIDQNINAELTLEKVAAHIGISKNYFSMLFKQQEKESFTNYVNRKKIEKAQQMLMSGRYKVYEVAALVGIENENYFSKLYKKYTGMSAGSFLHNKKTP